MSAQRKHASKDDSFAPVESAQALLDDAWKHMREILGHSPDVAQRVMTAAIRGFHKSETGGGKKAKRKSK